MTNITSRIWAMKKIAIIAGVLIGGALLISAAVFFAVSHLIEAGELRRYLIHEFEARTGLKVEVGETRVALGRVMGVSFENLVLRDPAENRAILTAPLISMRVALLPLVRRQVVFRGLRFDRPRLNVVRDKEGRTPWLDLLLKLPFQRRSGEGFSLDLRDVKIEQGEVLLSDRAGGTEPLDTRLSQIALRLRRVRGAGTLDPAVGSKQTAESAAARPELDFDLTMIVDRGGERADFAAAGRALFPDGGLDIRKARLDAQVRSQATPAALVWETSGRPFSASAPQGMLAYRFRWQGNFSGETRVNGEVRFAGLEAEAKNIFAAPITLGDGRLRMAFNWKAGEIRFERLDLQSAAVAFSARGAVGSLGTDDPQIRLHLTTPFFPLTTLGRYLPAGLARSPRWEAAGAALERGEIKFTKAEISGRLSELRPSFEPGQEKRLSFEAEVKDAGGKFGAEPGVAFTGFSGRIELERGELKYKNFHGTIGRTRVMEISGAERALAGGGSLDLRVKADVDLQQLRDEIPRKLFSPAVGKALDSLRDLGGRAGVDLKARADFISAPHYEGSVALAGVRLTTGDLALADLKGDVSFSPTEIRAGRATALLGGAPVQLRFVAKDFAGDDGTFDLTVDSTGVRASDALRLLLSADSESPGIVRGSVRYQGALASAGRRKLTGSLELAGVEIPVKHFDHPFRNIHGRVRLDGKTIDLQGIRAEVGGYAFALEGRWIWEDRPMFLFSLGAPAMDLSYIVPHRVVPDEEWYERLQVRGKLALEKAKYGNSAFADFKTDVALERRIWRLEKFFARAQGGTIEGAGAYSDRSEPGVFTVEPNIKGVPVQELLGWFGVATHEIAGKVQLAGKVEFSGATAAEKKQSLSGAFRARIEDGIVRRLQVLVRTLNFLDLSRWFSLKPPNLDQEGVHFRSVSADFKIARGVYSTQNFFLDGEDLRITGAGELDGAKGEIDFVMAVRPFPGIDRAANTIPILGTGLAAIKNSFLVASFNVKGPLGDPSITPAPLSTLSEYFFGVLAIPKGLIGISTTGESKAIDDPKPSEEPK
jgi:hypothetical protein